MWRVFLLLAVCLSSRAQFASFNDLPFLYKSASSGSVLPPANTVLWVDSVAGSTYRNKNGSTSPANTDVIEAYSDISGNNRHLTNSVASTSSGPIYTTGATPNSKPALTYGFGTTETLSNSFGGTTISQPNTVYVVMKYAQTGNSQEEFDSFNSSTREVVFNTPPIASQIYMFAGSSAQIGTQTSAFNGNWFVYAFQFNGNSSIFYTNGVQCVGSLTPGSGNLDGFCLGNRYDSATPSGSIIAAVLITASASPDSATVVHNVSQALGTEYGITIP